MAENVGKATLLDNGRGGFSGVLGSIPFPLINTSDDPLKVGGQLIWNHLIHWQGIWLNYWTSSFVVQGGNAPVLSAFGPSTFYYSYFDPSMTLDKFDGTFYKLFNRSIEPATMTGNAIDLLGHHRSRDASDQGLDLAGRTGPGAAVAGSGIRYAIVICGRRFQLRRNLWFLGRAEPE